MHYWGVGLEELLERYFASDDEPAMAELVRQTRPKLLAVARRICGEDAEDAVQTAYLSLAKKGGLGGAPVLPWLLTAAARIAYRARATRAREHAIAERLAPSAAPPEPPEIAIGGEEAELLRRELWKLPPDYRDALQLRYLHGLSGAETARLLGINDSTLRTRLQRGRLLLRSRLARVLHPFLVLPWLLNDTRASAALALGGIMKLKLALVAVLLVALGAYYAIARERAAEPRAAHAEAANRPASEASRTAATAGAPAAVRDDPDVARSEPASAEERQHYLEWRKVGPIFAESRRMAREAAALFEELGHEPEEASAVADPVTASYLRDLIREYRSLPAGAERLEVLGRIVETQEKYLAATDDASFLAFLEEVIRGSEVEPEREMAVPQGSELTLDLLLRLAGHDDPAVRAAAVRSLAGTEDPRVINAVMKGLGDRSSVVRWTAAIELEYAVADPVHVPALLDRLPREAHPLAADAMVRAVLALDPEGGARRIEGAVERAPDAVRAVVLSALRSPEPEPSDPAPRTTEAPEPRSDEETRAYLQRLLDDYRSLQGQERLAALEKLADAHADYLERSDDASFLPALAEIARGSPVVAERLAVVRSFRHVRDRRLVDLVVELKGSPEPQVRGAVAAALAWVRGAEAPRARRELLDLLADEAPSVRIAVASLLSVPLKDPENAARLLAALRQETDLIAAYAMIDAVLRLDPEGGAARVEAARSEAPPATRSVIESALRLRADREAR
ncbi:MAG: sigma-70 family RNA polymerase sigma factor [Planctomycetota bacterium]